MRPLLVAALLLTLGTLPAVAGEVMHQLEDALVIPRLGGGGRVVAYADPLAGQLVRGEWTAPEVGVQVAAAGGEAKTWKALKTNENGWLRDGALRGGYAYWSFDHPREEVVLLSAAGHSLVYVNGQLHTGDPYAHGWLSVPVELREGRNELLFRVGRGRVRAAIEAVDGPVTLRRADLTKPDLVAGVPLDGWLGVVVVNALPEPVRIRATISGHEKLRGRSAWTTMAPVSTHKLAIPIKGEAGEWAETEMVDTALEMEDREGVVDTLAVKLKRRGPGQTRRVTFRSNIDGSVQYYAVRPMVEDVPRRSQAPALFLSLHGASVKATNQANAYAAKQWGYIVAPTNRRTFGFDWEDWGRRDALEVLEDAAERYGTDPHRTYLTGHSMGGHGTWHLGVTWPDRFAAIGPSAGWISFWSYAGGRAYDAETPVGALLQRATNPSQTLALAENLRHVGVYILHGDADDNVPVGQAREMRDQLAELGLADVHYHEQAKAGHWWNSTDEPGADCVDWQPMFDLFAARTRPVQLRHLQFVTANPGISHRYHWAEIHRQPVPLALSRVDLRADPHKRRVRGSTENVDRLLLVRPPVLPGDLTLVLDDQTLEEVRLSAKGEVRLERDAAGVWKVVNSFDAAEKRPGRYGPFKEAFSNRFVLVYGTRGTAEENRWSLERARYDAETFYYRGNGAPLVISDEEALTATYGGRNLILYGNADTNAAFSELAADCPVTLRRDHARLNDEGLNTSPLGMLFVYPRGGSESALIGVVGGTTVEGCRLTDRLPYFVSGVAYPDLFVVGPEVLTGGVKGVVAAAFFDGDWRLAALATPVADGEKGGGKAASD